MTGMTLVRNEAGFTVGNRPPSLTARRYKQPPTSNSPSHYSRPHLSLALCRSSKMLLTRPLAILSIALLFFATVDAVGEDRSYASVLKGPSRLPSPSDSLDALSSDSDDALPSDSEFRRALLTEAPYQSALLTKAPFPWSASIPHWVPSPNPDPSSIMKHYTVPRFTIPDGPTFGPFPIGTRKFQPTPYPLSIPHFQNTYTRNALLLADFEDVANGWQLLDGERIYRPEPNILEAVREAVHAPLTSHGWKPREQGQGEFLWPPTVVHNGKGISGLEMPAGRRSELHRELMSSLMRHSQTVPKAWRLTVRTKGWKRKVLMSKANAEKWVDTAKGGKNDDDFWLFHEAFLEPRPPNEVGVTKLAFLGGMFLPKDAIGKLEEAKSVKPAFQSQLLRSVPPSWRAYTSTSLRQDGRREGRSRAAPPSATSTASSSSHQPASHSARSCKASQGGGLEKSTTIQTFLTVTDKDVHHPAHHSLSVAHPSSSHAFRVRKTPIFSGLLAPFSIVLEVPGLTSKWYADINPEGQVIRFIPNPTILTVGLSISLTSAVIANFAIILRFLEILGSRQSIALAIASLALHDIINVVALAVFGGIYGPKNDGLSLSASYWMVCAGTITSTLVTASLVMDYVRTKDFKHAGSGLTQLQKGLVLAGMGLLLYLSLGSLIFVFVIGVDFITALYFSTATVLTVGFGDVVPGSAGGKVLVVLYAPTGIVLVALVVSAARSAMLETFQATLLERTKERRRRIRERKERLKEEKREERALKKDLPRTFTLSASEGNDFAEALARMEQDASSHPLSSLSTTATTATTITTPPPATAGDAILQSQIASLASTPPRKSSHRVRLPHIRIPHETRSHHSSPHKAPPRIQRHPRLLASRRSSVHICGKTELWRSNVVLFHSDDYDWIQRLSSEYAIGNGDLCDLGIDGGCGIDNFVGGGSGCVWKYFCEGADE
ncbi:uncharacterized protein UBRO_20380 [Ustilago bromivora]|uniref:Potassium channel domain-containing protein n=1 Tax=Ustilago bromivora TaxID=307758 RepID=A0A1K0H995_9BASI|nr:uncharacterized protein UBRO_20380 [Ustilago bromivora]